MKTYTVNHHSATPDGRVLRDFDAIKREHLSRGYRDVGYHWVIERVNDILVAIPGRAEWDVGAHCPKRNYDGIAVCVIGNFEKEFPDEELYQFTAEVCRNIQSRHPIIETAGHGDYDNTLCPGKNFDLSYLRKLIREGSKLIDDVKITIKGKEIIGKLINGKTYAPVRELVEALNNTVVWDSSDKSVTIR